MNDSPRTFDPSEFKEGMLDEIQLDDFAVAKPSGGVMHPHRGESVWIMPYGFSLQDELRVAEFAGLDEGAAPGEVDAAFDAIAELMSRLIVGWNITDPRGRPYPQPTEGPGAIKGIPSRLFKHILDAVRGTEPEGNDAGASSA